MTPGAVDLIPKSQNSLQMGSASPVMRFPFRLDDNQAKSSGKGMFSVPSVSSLGNRVLDPGMRCLLAPWHQC